MGIGIDDDLDAQLAGKNAMGVFEIEPGRMRINLEADARISGRSEYLFRIK